MRKISERLTQLHWARVSWFGREFELRSDEGLVATMRLRGILRPTGIVESGDGSWTFERTGAFQNHATIRSAETAKDVATFHASFWNSAGVLTFENGHRFTLAPNFWATRLEARAESGELALILHKRGLCGRRADVEILPGASHQPEIPLLVAFGWFLFVMLEQDTAGIVAMTG